MTLTAKCGLAKNLTPPPQVDENFVLPSMLNPITSPGLYWVAPRPPKRYGRIESRESPQLYVKMPW